ncbi:MAG: conjugal transfer protein TraF [Vicinamibacterales bacterium]
MQALTTSTVGVSLLHSLTDHIVVGATPKLVRGSAARGLFGAVSAEDALEAAADLDGDEDTTFDIDAAVMLAVEQIRIGLVARNLTTPAFAMASASAKATADRTAGEPGEEGGEIEMAREVRAGFAWGSGWPGNSRVTLSVDADLTERVTPFGDRRDVAVGVETWWRDRRLSLRGGVRRSTTGEARGAVTGGASYAVRQSMFVEGHAAAGERSERGWSLGIRMGF